jgi:hypothetical protein
MTAEQQQFYKLFQLAFPQLDALARVLGGNPPGPGAQPTYCNPSVLPANYREVIRRMQAPRGLAALLGRAAEAPPNYDEALDLMLSRPGMTYASAMDQVQQLAGAAPPAPAPVPPGPPAGQADARQRRVQEYLAKWGPQATEDAEMFADYLIPIDLEPGRAARPTGGLAGGLADGQKGRGWVQVSPPKFHEQAVAHMLAHSGARYEDAYDHVSRGGR